MLDRALDEINPYGQEDTAWELEERWRMDEPRISYNPDSDVFTLDFITSSAENDPDGMTYTFFDENCMYAGEDDRVQSDEYRIPLYPIGGISNPAGDGPAEMLDNGIDGRPRLQFKLDHAVLAANPNLFTTNP